LCCFELCCRGGRDIGLNQQSVMYWLMTQVDEPTEKRARGLMSLYYRAFSVFLISVNSHTGDDEDVSRITTTSVAYVETTLWTLLFAALMDNEGLPRHHYLDDSQNKLE
jgi:hypothetical protein